MENIENQVMNIIRSSNEAYRSEGVQAALNQLLQAWEMLPEPKTQHNMSTVLASFIANYYLEQQLFDEALHWGNILKEGQKYKIDSGEGYFLCGKIYYEMGDTENALQEFSIAWEKSDGRIFSGKPKQYAAFLKAGRTK